MEEIQASVLKYRVPPLQPTYTCERRMTFAKAYGTQLERKNPTPPIRKKGGPIHFIMWLLIGCMEIFFLKFGCPYFWPGLRALPKSTLPVVIHINYFTGVLTLLSFLEGAILAHHQLFWEHWALPNRSTYLDHSCKIETHVLLMGHLFSLYTSELNFGQTILG